MAKKINIFFIFILVVYSFSFSQKKLNIAYQQRYGFIFPHRPSIAYLIEKHIVACDFQISKFFEDTCVNWHKQYKFPEGGLGIYFSNLGNNKITGSAISTYSFLNIPLNQKKLLFNISIGISYITKFFDYKNNYTNIVISTPLNAFISLGLIKDIFINNLNISPGISFTHFSNGAWTKPNLGFNIPSVNIKIKYNNNKPHINKISVNYLSTYKEFSVFMALGIRQNLPQTPHFLVNTFSLNYNKTKNNKFKYGCGVDLFYDPSIIPRTQQISDYDQYYPYIRSGFRGNLIMIIGKIELLFQTGFYFYDPKLPDGPIYSRLGLNLNFYKNFQFNIWLKSHFIKADVIEWGLSWFIRK